MTRLWDAAATNSVSVLRALADTGERSAAVRLVTLLLNQGRVDQLSREVAAGTPMAADA
ncbi:hypothetical protein GCM10010170_069980 [Dactylosporangium salmoneum]|uniref:Uncharacterized protein n=1 Tax=Dactylosporangium salmoneum TaxID=53361 RepID=A0ABP5U725_9ACTN